MDLSRKAKEKTLRWHENVWPFANRHVVVCLNHISKSATYTNLILIMYINRLFVLICKENDDGGNAVQYVVQSLRLGVDQQRW